MAALDALCAATATAEALVDRVGVGGGAACNDARLGIVAAELGLR